MKIKCHNCGKHFETDGYVLFCSVGCRIKYTRAPENLEIPAMHKRLKKTYEHQNYLFLLRDMDKWAKRARRCHGNLVKQVIPKYFPKLPGNHNKSVLLRDFGYSKTAAFHILGGFEQC